MILEVSLISPAISLDDFEKVEGKKNTTTQIAPMFDVNRLPKDILHLTLSFVDLPQILSLSKMGKNFNEFYKKIRGVDLKINQGKIKEFINFSNSKNSFKKIRSLTLIGSWEGRREDESLSYLYTSLRPALTYTNTNLSHFLTHIETKFDPLNHLILSESGIDELEPMMKVLPETLRRLEIISPKVHASPCDMTGFTVPEKIISFKFSGFDAAPCNRSAHLKTFATHLRKNLRHLSLSVYFDNEMFNHIIELESLLSSLPPSIETLEFTREEFYQEPQHNTDKTIDVTHLPNLRKLNVDGTGINPNSKIISKKPVLFSAFPSANPLIRDILAGKNVSLKELNTLKIDKLEIVGHWLSDPRINSKCHTETVYEFASLFLRSIKEYDRKKLQLDNIINLYEFCKKKGVVGHQEELGKLCYKVASLYKKDKTPENFAKYLEKAIEHDHKKARHDLASLYMDGRIKADADSKNKKSSDEIALELLFPLAQADDAIAQDKVGNLYVKMKKNKEAKMWLLKAAGQGLKSAMESLRKLKLLH